MKDQSRFHLSTRRSTRTNRESEPALTIGRLRARKNHVPLFFARDLLPVPRVSREDKNDWLVFVAPPKFSITPEEMIYVNVGDAIILNCQAEGTPTPEILWYKDANPVEPSSTIGIFNDGTELRISTIKSEDIGDYTCIARNGEGQISHTARVIIAGEYRQSRSPNLLSPLPFSSFYHVPSIL